MITFRHSGNFNSTEKFLKRASDATRLDILDRLAQKGVYALSLATPVDTGLTASMWGYEIRQEAGATSIIWTNVNVNSGATVAILLQYGHGTGTGGYVQGVDYINPAIRPIFESIANDVWKEVTK